MAYQLLIAFPTWIDLFCFNAVCACEVVREQVKVQTTADSVTKKSEAADKKESEEERRQRIKEWRVVLHNDDIHT